MANSVIGGVRSGHALEGVIFGSKSYVFGVKKLRTLQIGIYGVTDPRAPLAARSANEVNSAAQQIFFFLDNFPSENDENLRFSLCFELPRNTGPRPHPVLRVLACPIH